MTGADSSRRRTARTSERGLGDGRMPRLATRDGGSRNGRARRGPCDDCLRRTWLLARLGNHLERAREQGRRLPLVLALPDDELIEALGGAQHDAVVRDYARFRPAPARDAIDAAGLEAVCRCEEDRYPPALAGGEDAPAVLHVAGGLDRLAELIERDPVAIVGARRGSPYGLGVARGLGRGLAAAGVTVVSGMALGIDAAAHVGALETGVTVAVLAGGADRAYPARHRGLYERILERGLAIAELPPGTTPWRWSFPARNRIIAGLAMVTVVVEAGERSGSLITADFAAQLGRDVGAVPGHVTSPLAAGTHGLLAAGAALIGDAHDVLDMLAAQGGPARTAPERPQPAQPRLRAMLDEIAAGRDTVGRLVGAGVAIDEALVGLVELEALGHIRREIGGHLVVMP
jgi:DNA processing protein